MRFSSSLPRLIATLSISCALFACGESTTTTRPADPTTRAAAPDARSEVVIADDDKNELTLKTGGTLSVRLRETPGTGYAWHVVSVEGTAVDRGEDTVEAEAPARPGGAATRVFRFVAARPGSAKVKLVHARAWDKDSEPLATRTIVVDVR